MGSRSRRRARDRKLPRAEGSVRAAGTVGAVIAIASAIVTIILATQWWIPTACFFAAGAFGYLAYRGYDLRSPRVLAMGIAITVVGTLAARGAWEVRPFRGYEGEFIVVGKFIVQPASAPFENAVGPVELTYGEGDTIIVDCKTSGLKDPKEIWYRVKGEHVFVSSTDVVPSYADPPDTPPNC